MSKLDSIKLADYTRTEDWINSISHMVGGGLSVLATLLCIYKAFKAWSWQYLIAALIYGLTMIAMYTCSAVYHALRPNNGKKAMRMVDHSMIYLMIAGTITPFAWLVIMPVNFKAGGLGGCVGNGRYCNVYDLLFVQHNKNNSDDTVSCARLDDNRLRKDTLELH